MVRSKGILLLVTTLLVLALAVPMAAQVNPFSDVSTDHWAYEAISILAEAGLIVGYPDGTFGGDRTFTRYEMAEVFARMLARLENQVDQRVGTQLGDIDARADRLAAEIAAARAALESIVGDDSFVERLAALEDIVDDHLAERSSVGGPAGVLELSPEALDVLSEQALVEAVTKLRTLGEDQDALARRVLRLEGSTPNRAEAQQIAQEIVANALAEITGDIDQARRAAALEAGAASQVISGRVDELDVAIRALAEEYRPELENLGVRVDRLESRVDQHAARIDQHGEQLGSILARLGRFELSGLNTTGFHHRSFAGENNPRYLEDPRDEDSKDYENLLPSETEFYNNLRLTLESERSNDVYIKASADVSTVTFQKPTHHHQSRPMFLRPESVDILVTTPGVLKHLHGGRLDRDHIAASFNKYMLDAEAFDEEYDDYDDKSGVDFLIGSGRTSVDGFLARIDQDEFAHGVAANIALSDDIRVNLSDVRYHASGNLDAVWGGQIAGRLGLLDFSALGASHRVNGEKRGDVHEVHAAMPIGLLSVGAKKGAVSNLYNPAFRKKELESYDADIGPDWINRLVNGEEEEFDWLGEGESEYAAWVGLPILGSESTVTFGQRDDDAGENKYVQLQVGLGLISGIDVDVLYDRRKDENNDEDRTFGVQIGTSIIGFDVDANVISRENAQAWAEPEQKHTYVTAKRDIDFILPLQVEGRYATSDSATSSPHTYIGIGVDRYMLGNVALNGSYSTSRNHVDPKYWWINSEWSGQDRNELVLGAGYTFNRLFGFVVDAGYEFKQVMIDGSVDGEAQHSIKTVFERGLGVGRLDGEAKYVVGGISDRDGNDRDLTAKLNVTYPVFEGGTFKLSSVYVSSQGEKELPGGPPVTLAPVYELFDVKAGLEIAF